MARFVSTNLNRRADLIPDGVGPLSNPLSERSPLPDPGSTMTYDVDEFVLNVPAYNVTLVYSGESIAYNNSGDIYGLTGIFKQEEMFDSGISRYILSEINLTPVDFFMNATWETVFAGNDQIYLSDQDDQVNAGSGDDIVEAGRGFDRIWAGSGDDYVQGGFNGDQIYGEAGNDDLRGGNGLDLIVGGVGNDTIRGAKGTDTLTGGEGADVFIFHTDLDGTINVDTITDFVSGVDRIELSSAIFGNAGAIGANVGLSQYITYNAATGVLSYDQDGTGAGAAKAFAILGTDSHPTSVDNIFWITA
jgi:RTX calcium-binding nonapeptide repeat (4 copies)